MQAVTMDHSCALALPAPERPEQLHSYVSEGVQHRRGSFIWDVGTIAVGALGFLAYHWFNGLNSQVIIV